jgi:hypothetical protein
MTEIELQDAETRGPRQIGAVGDGSWMAWRSWSESAVTTNTRTR